MNETPRLIVLRTGRITEERGGDVSKTPRLMFFASRREGEKFGFTRISARGEEPGGGGEKGEDTPVDPEGRWICISTTVVFLAGSWHR